MMIRTVGDLRAALADRHDEDRISFEHDEGDGACCEDHVHDITRVWGMDADIDVTPASITITVSGGDV